MYVNPHRRRHELNLCLSCHGIELLTHLVIGKKDKTPAICLALKGDFPLLSPQKDLNTHFQERTSCVEQGVSL